MASNRHLGRIIALQTLYEQDFRRASADVTFDLATVLKRNISRYEATVDDTDFIVQLVEGVDKECEALDALLQPLAPEWPLKDIARMDRVILRMGAYELVHSKKVPPKVVINEAVELAKAFGSENSSKFINGVLGTLLRHQNGEPALPPKIKPPKPGEIAAGLKVAVNNVSDDAEISQDTEAASKAADIPVADRSAGVGVETPAQPEQKETP